MLGTLGEDFLLKAFFAGTLDKISDFKIVFKIILFFGHCWRPFFASLDFFNHEIHKLHETVIGLN
jgi:hypothetical protein